MQCTASASASPSPTIQLRLETASEWFQEVRGCEPYGLRQSSPPASPCRPGLDLA
jgi:hypothetical protein